MQHSQNNNTINPTELPYALPYYTNVDSKHLMAGNMAIQGLLKRKPAEFVERLVSLIEKQDFPILCYTSHPAQHGQDFANKHFSVLRKEMGAIITGAADCSFLDEYIFDTDCKNIFELTNNETMSQEQQESDSKDVYEWFFWERHKEIERLFHSLPKRGLLIVDFDLGANSWSMVQAAKTRGWHVATLVHATPNKNFIPTLADSILVWGERQKEWFKEQDSTHSSTHIIGRCDVSYVAPDKSAPNQLVLVNSGEKLTKLELQRLTSIKDEAEALGLKVGVSWHPLTKKGYPRYEWNEFDTLPDVGDSKSTIKAGNILVGVQSTVLLLGAISGIQSVCVKEWDKKPEEFPDLMGLESRVNFESVAEETQKIFTLIRFFSIDAENQLVQAVNNIVDKIKNSDVSSF